MWINKLIITALTSSMVNCIIFKDYDDNSAATHGQIKFAEEQNYDNTGPHSNIPNIAYKTYDNIKEAIVGYLDDPDTKLPLTERIKAESSLTINNIKPSFIPRLTDMSDVFTFMKSPVFPSKNILWPVNAFDKTSGRNGIKKYAYAQNNYNGNPTYSFSYDVQDAATGDTKRQHEVRKGDAVTGYYTVIEPDGVERTVRYTADDKDGFKAVVERTPN